MEVKELRVWQHDTPSALVAMVHVKCSQRRIGLTSSIKKALSQHGIRISAVEIHIEAEEDMPVVEPAFACGDCECGDIDCGDVAPMWRGSGRSPLSFGR